MSRILVPLDGSPLAETALSKAIDLSRIADAPLMLLRAVEAHVFPGGDPVDPQVRVVHDAEEYLARIKERLGSSGVRDITTSVSPCEGGVGAELARDARRHMKHVLQTQ